MFSSHRVLMGVLLIGNTIAFAGVDPISRALTAGLVVVIIATMPKTPEVPLVHRWCAALLGTLAAAQLVPLPETVRSLLQPGFAEVLPSGWSSLSLAPWSTVQVASSFVVALGVALCAARMASARTGLPILVGILAGTCALLAVLGIGGEAGAPQNVLLFRANSGGGSVYGPFVNRNHFALAIELTLPAALVLIAAGVRRFSDGGLVRQRAAVMVLAGTTIAAVGAGAMLRCGSRGGILFLVVAGILTIPLWRRPVSTRNWPWVSLLFAALLATALLASSRISSIREDFTTLLAIEGVEGNTRWDLWRGTLDSWLRAPVPGSGMGSYRYVIGLDKPATNTSVLAQAHNDWLEWLSTSGVAGFAILAVFVGALVVFLWPGRVRRLRHEYRYPLAGAAFALLATGLHELIGFGLQTPLNRYLLAAWIGLVWGIDHRRRRRSADFRGESYDDEPD